MRGERRGMAGTLRTPLIFWNQITGVDGEPLPQPPDAALVKAPLRIAGLLFCGRDAAAWEAAWQSRQRQPSERP